jgi:glycyl-tRNA synthetase
VDDDEAGHAKMVELLDAHEIDGAVTIRDRDTMEQIRLPINQVVSYIEERCKF